MCKNTSTSEQVELETPQICGTIENIVFCLLSKERTFACHEGRVAQLVSARVLWARGRGFESLHDHYPCDTVG